MSESLNEFLALLDDSYLEIRALVADLRIAEFDQPLMAAMFSFRLRIHVIKDTQKQAGPAPAERPDDEDRI